MVIGSLKCQVGLGDGSTVEAVGVGRVRLDMLFRVEQAVLYDVLHVPKLSCNLFSVRAAASKGNSVNFGQSKCWIFNRNRELCGMGYLVRKVYQLLVHLSSTASQPSLSIHQ